MIYRRRASPLHAARAGVGCAYCLALTLAALLLSAPVPLAAVVVAIAGAAVGAGVVREMRRAALLAIPLGLLVMAVNMLVAQGGLTVIARLGDLPVFGQTDVTLEATVYGAVLGVRAIALVLCGALYTVAVDPDEVLGLFRRLSFHSALTATLATRMVPVLARDARRLAEAQRCRPGRATVPRAAHAGGDVRRSRPRARCRRSARGARVRRGAALPGAGGADRAPTGRTRATTSRLRHPRWRSRRLAIGARVAGLAPFESDPSLHAPVGAGTVAVAVAIVVCALLPFADRRGIER